MKKKRNIFLISLFIVTMYSLSFADTLYLKSGKEIKGEIVERNEEIIKIRVKGRIFERVLTYSLDEVGWIGTSPVPQKEDSEEAIYSLQVLITALLTYNMVQSPPQYPENLYELSLATPPYVDDEKLAKGEKGSYVYKYSPVIDSEGIRSKFTIVAIPQGSKANTYATYFVDETGAIRVGTSADAPIFGRHKRDSTVEFLESKSPLEKSADEKIKANLEAFEELFFNGHTDDDLKKLIRIGESLLQIEPQDKQIRRKVAFLYFVAGDHDKALKYYDITLKAYTKKERLHQRLKFDTTKSSEMQRLLLQMAAIYNNNKEFEKMIDYYRQYLRASYPDDDYKKKVAKGFNIRDVRFETLRWLGMEGMFSFKVEIKSLANLLRDYPNDVEVFYELGNSNLAFARGLKHLNAPGFDEYIDKALDLFTKTLEVSPTDGHTRITLFRLAELYELKEEYGAAIDTYKEAIKLHPQKDSCTSYIDLLRLYKKTKRFDEGIAEAERLLADDSYLLKRKIESKLAEIYEEKGDYEKAKSVYEKLSKESDWDAEKEVYKNKILVLEKKLETIE